MTDEKVKEAVERLIEFAEAVDWQPADACTINGRTISCEDLRALVSDRLALQAERDKLSEDLAAAAMLNDARCDYATGLEAKLTALVEALTPSADTKAAYMGEFEFGLSRVDEFGDDQTLNVAVPWDTTKQIMAAIRERALAHHSAQAVDIDAEDARAMSPEALAEAKMGELLESVGLIAAGWEVIESDGSCMTIQAPDHWDEPGDRERIIDLTTYAAALPERPAPSAPPSTPTSAPVEGEGWLSDSIQQAREAVERNPRFYADMASNIRDGAPVEDVGGWLPIVLCPTDGVDRLVKLSDGREVVACFDGGLLGRRRWTVRTVAYHNPARVIGQRGGVDQWSAAYDTYLVSDLPEGIAPTHFRPNDTVHGATAPRPPEVDDCPIVQQDQPDEAALIQPQGEERS